MKASTFIIDDVDTTRSLIRLLLKSTPYEVVGESDTLLGAFQKLVVTKPDLIILDVEMPDGNGIDAIPNLRAILPDVTVVVASAHNDAGSVRSALQMGAHGYLLKPFTPGALEDAIAGAWRRSGKAHLPPYT
ncbi:response regulator transcription factor [Massilia sp. SR12]